MITIDYFIKKAKELGISQYEIAKRCNVSPQQINAYWTQRSVLGLRMQNKLIMALGVKIEIK